MNRGTLYRRVVALNKALNLSGLIGARLAKLTEDQRGAYDHWRDQCARYYSHCPGGSAYARLLSGEQPPPLRPDVRKALFGPTPFIPNDATASQAAEIYQRFCQGD